MNQLPLSDQSRQFLTLREASEWASQYLNRNITISNISYLIQYGRLKKYGSNGKPLVKMDDLKALSCFNNGRSMEESPGG